MLFADVSEYLPTSESLGFRITVHDKWVAPFPDAFGYNAPTGFLSSFGVRMVTYCLASVNVLVAQQLFLSMNMSNFRSNLRGFPLLMEHAEITMITPSTFYIMASTIPLRYSFAHFITCGAQQKLEMAINRFKIVTDSPTSPWVEEKSSKTFLYLLHLEQLQLCRFVFSRRR